MYVAMWDFAIKECNGGRKPDLNQCMYVGDAAVSSSSYMHDSHMQASCHHCHAHVAHAMCSYYVVISCVHQGRAAGWKTGASRDFSCTDRAFAHNIGIGFATETEFFHRAAPCKFGWRELSGVDAA